ncbi:hypothetical protein V7166_04725 [Bacillus thuringiensis]
MRGFKQKEHASEDHDVFYIAMIYMLKHENEYRLKSNIPPFLFMGGQEHLAMLSSGQGFFLPRTMKKTSASHMFLHSATLYVEILKHFIYQAYLLKVLGF